MKEYNKEKLHEYAKELFALCLEKGIEFHYRNTYKCIILTGSKIERDRVIFCYIGKEDFNLKGIAIFPIWELIEKVKQL